MSCHKGFDRVYFTLLLVIAIAISTLILTACGGGGGGGGSTPSEQTEFIYSTTANNKGTFRLTSAKSGAIVESSEEETLASRTSVVLIERLPKSNESKLFQQIPHINIEIR